MKRTLTVAVAVGAVSLLLVSCSNGSVLRPAEYSADSAAEYATHYVGQILELQNSPYTVESEAEWAGVITNDTLNDEALHAEYNEWARTNTWGAELFSNIVINYNPKDGQAGREVITGIIYRGLADGSLNYDFNIQNLPVGTEQFVIDAYGIELRPQNNTAIDLSTSYELYDSAGQLLQTIPSGEFVKKLQLKYSTNGWVIYFDMDNY